MSGENSPIADLFGRTKTSLNKDIEHLQNAVSAHIAAMKENLKKELKDELKKELIEELKKEMKEEMKAVYQRYELEKEKNRKLMNLLEESKQISSQLETKIHILSSEADSTLNEFAAKVDEPVSGMQSEPSNDATDVPSTQRTV